MSSKHKTWIVALTLAAGLPCAALAQDGADNPQPVAPGSIPDPTGATRPQPQPQQPPAQPQPQAQPQPPGEEPEIILQESAEPIELRTLVEYVAEALSITITASEDLSGSFVLNSPQAIRRDQLLPFLDSLLESKGYTIVQDRPGFYRIIKIEDLPASQTITRIIPTPTIRPSSLQELVNNQLGRGGAAQGAPTTLRIAYLDDLGVIVATETPRRMETLVNLVERVLSRASEQSFMRFELEHIAASVARMRVLDLLGQQQQQLNPLQPQLQVPMVPGGGVIPGTITNLADRLTVDPQGNALILRGFETEAVRVQEILGILDQPNILEFRQYQVGTAAAQIAGLAEKRGLGSVETIDTGGYQGLTDPMRQNQQANFQQQQFQQQGLLPFGQQQPQVGGPVLIVDEGRGTITYYGTPSQQGQLAKIIETMEVGQDALVIETYKLKNSPALAVAEVIQAILTNETPTDTGSGFLPGSEGERRRGGRRSRTDDPTGTMEGGLGGLGRDRSQGNTEEGTGITSFGYDEIFVVADRANNQLLVKAPARQQPEFAKLIMRLDQRRPQVYINVQIVAVADTDDFRLAVETQLINAGGSGGAINTNFGLGTFPATGTGPNAPSSFVAPKLVNTNLGGITSAVILSDYVPIIINAIKQETDARILSSPQLLVDDNEEAYIASIEEQPTSTAVAGTATTNTSFGGYEEAGTELTVTPSISEAGYMRLSYEILLSNFRGQAVQVGDTQLPPVREKREVSSDSVTIPDGATIVVGGIKVDTRSNTVIKVPLLGDIPILGHLFRDTNVNSASTRLYVFITPTILRDATFRDLILLSKGPQAEAVVDPDMPPLEPVSIRLGEREAPPVLPPRPTGSNPEPDPLDERLPVRIPELPGGPAPAAPSRPEEPAAEPELPPVPMH